MIGFRVIDRVGKGLRTPARDALIAAVTPPESRGRAFGFHRGADHFGAVLGSVAAWLLLEQGLDGPGRDRLERAPGAIAFLVLALLLRGTRAGTTALNTTPGQAAADATGRIFWGPVLVLTALTFFRVPEALLLLRLQDLGVAVPAIPLVWAGLHVVRSGSSYPGGWIADRWDRGRRWRREGYSSPESPSGSAAVFPPPGLWPPFSCSDRWPV